MTREKLIELFDNNNETLSKYEKNKKRIKDINKDIEKIQKKSDTKVTTSYKEVSNGKTNTISKNIENVIERKEEIIEKLKEEKANLEAENEKLKSNVEDVEIALKALKFKEKTIIIEHYIEGNNYEDIGNRVFWKIFGQTRGWETIKKIADRAMEKMLKI